MKKDAAQKTYLKKAERVADVLNGHWFQGKSVIRPEDVKKADGHSMFYVNGKPDSKIVERYHDIVFHIVRGANCIIVGLEEQNYVDPAMVLRAMEYLIGQYEEQRQAVMNYHKTTKDLKDDEYLSRFSIQDLLKPVIILVIYFGDDEWSGARTLHELLDWTDIPEDWKPMFADYQMHLLEVKKIENLDQYHSDLKLLFGILKYRKDKEKMEEFINDNKDAFQEVAADLVDVICEYSHSQEVLKMIEENKKEDERSTVDMCQAFEEMIEDGRRRGIEEGKQEGREEGMELLSKLVFNLLTENRMDELCRASKDAEYRKQLLQEYEIAG